MMALGQPSVMGRGPMSAPMYAQPMVGPYGQPLPAGQSLNQPSSLYGGTPSLTAYGQPQAPPGLAQTSLISGNLYGQPGYSTATMGNYNPYSTQQLQSCMYLYRNSLTCLAKVASSMIPRAAALAVTAPTFQPQEGNQCVKCNVEWSMFTRKVIWRFWPASNH